MKFENVPKFCWKNGSIFPEELEDKYNLSAEKIIEKMF